VKESESQSSSGSSSGDISGFTLFGQCLHKLASQDPLHEVFGKKGGTKRDAWRKGANRMLLKIASTTIWTTEDWEALFSS
jgi:hypothetical protein